MLSAGSIAGGGFRLVRERPGAAAVWTLVFLAAVVAVALAMRPNAAMAGGDPAAAMTPSLSAWFWLAELVFFVLFMVLLTAALRAALRPGEGGIAAIRLGMDELRMTGLALLLFVLLYLGLIVIGIVLAILLGALTAVVGIAGVTIIAVVEICLLAALTIWILVRISLAYPLTLLRGRIVIGEAWRLSRGRFWTLFGGYLVVFLAVLAFATAAAMVTAGPYFEAIARDGFSLQSLQAATQAQLARQAAGIDAMMVVGWLLSALTGGLSLALYAGAMASAARELATDREGIARTFA